MKKTLKFIPTRLPADRAYPDEIRIRRVDRYKSSSLSGSEYRVSYRVELLWKDMVIATTAVGDYQYALVKAQEGLALWPSELEMHDHWEVVKLENLPDDLCCHYGCTNKATHKMVCLKNYSSDGRFSEDADLSGPYLYGRQFCEDHKHRGDCGLDDSDSNYKPFADFVHAQEE